MIPAERHNHSGTPTAAHRTRWTSHFFPAYHDDADFSSSQHNGKDESFSSSEPDLSQFVSLKRGAGFLRGDLSLSLPFLSELYQKREREKVGPPGLAKPISQPFQVFFASGLISIWRELKQE